ncbi:MAG TPA: DUF4166 domain-containing protein [Pseudonocardiaceae bacterium]|nr:DUF4166 domain-containing protein [Pseudonocardiaceae bacterium]
MVVCAIAGYEGSIAHAVNADVALVLLPPLPTTPAARRCLRTSPRRSAVERRCSRSSNVPSARTRTAAPTPRQPAHSADAHRGRFRIEVAVINRWFGPLFGYRGTFDVVYPACDTVPATVVPLREQLRI